MSIRKLTEYAKNNGISVDEYAAHLMDTAEACSNALAELSRYADRINEEAESLRAGFEATMKAKQQEVEQYRDRYRSADKGIIAMGAFCDELKKEVEHWRGKARELEGVVSARIEIINDMVKEETAIIERAEREEGFHGQ